jgi:hypothetical protein
MVAFLRFVVQLRNVYQIPVSGKALAAGNKHLEFRSWEKCIGRIGG